MGELRIRRHRGWRDDVIGGALTFLLEAAVVVGLGLVALLIAAIVLALT